MDHDEWRQYFNTLSNQTKMKLSEAINTIKTDKMLKDEYEWTGLFLLGSIIENEIKHGE